MGYKGVKITSLAIELNVDEESKQRIAKFQEAKTVGSDPSMLYAMDRMSINKAREAAASNANGVMAGFMGMGMAGGMMGQPMDATMYQQQMQQNMMNQQAAQAAPQQAAPAAAPTQAAPENGWTCACGTTNTGKFCANCGQPKPEPKPAADSWKCSCGTENTGKFCANCGSPKPEQPVGWTCSCGAVNKGKFCAECGKPKPASEPLYKCDKCGWEPEDPKILLSSVRNVEIHLTITIFRNNSYSYFEPSCGMRGGSFLWGDVRKCVGLYSLFTYEILKSSRICDIIYSV